MSFILESGSKVKSQAAGEMGGYTRDNLGTVKGLLPYELWRHAMKKKKIILAGIVLSCAAAGVGSRVLNMREEKDREYADSGTCRRLGSDATFYEKYIKRGLDIGAALAGVVISAPVVAAASVLIYREDPGNTIFWQKRVGVNGTYFNIHKLRSMKQNTGDIPTHLLGGARMEGQILKIGRVIRRTSIDELPQCVDILRGRMSIVGPRPALWNQDDLVAERDKYGANGVRPGLTGWAQIHGRDELEISEKARLDGVYCQELRKSSWNGFKMDCRCFLGTIRAVISSDGVVEGGTGTLRNSQGRSKTVMEEKVPGGVGKRTLGDTGIECTEMGFGCASIWGKKYISDEDAAALFEKAYELGIRYFDTGYSYGIAEERIGKILRSSKNIKREEIIISTKFGTKLVNGKYIHDWSPEWMRESVETSLRRMGIEQVDLCMCHGPQVSDLTTEFINAMRRLKEEGLTRAIGINTFDTDVLEYVRDTKCFDFVMLDYNIMRQDREGLIQELYDKGIGVIAGAPLAESLYSNRVFQIHSRKDIWYLMRALANHRDKLAQKHKFSFMNHVDGASSTQIALRYVLDNPGVTTAVFGTTTMAHLVENVEAVDIMISDDIKRKIRQQKK